MSDRPNLAEEYRRAHPEPPPATAVDVPRVSSTTAVRVTGTGTRCGKCGRTSFGERCVVCEGPDPDAVQVNYTAAIGKHYRTDVAEWDSWYEKSQQPPANRKVAGRLCYGRGRSELIYEDELTMTPQRAMEILRKTIPPEQLGLDL